MNQHQVITVASLSPAQCRAARALLGWSQSDLAERSGVAKATIAYFETAKREPYRKTLSDLRRVLESSGVSFIEPDGGGRGVRLTAAPAHGGAQEDWILSSGA